MIFGGRLKPDREAAGEEEAKSGRLGDDAAGRGDDHPLVLGQCLLQRAELVPAVSVGAVEVVDLGVGAAGELLDLP